MWEIHPLIYVLLWLYFELAIVISVAVCIAFALRPYDVEFVFNKEKCWISWMDKEGRETEVHLYGYKGRYLIADKPNSCLKNNIIEVHIRDVT